MNERIHQVLDGDLAREALSPAERHELEALEAVLAIEPPGGGACPDLADGVMRRIDALEAERRPGALGQITRWLWTPRPISFALRPAHAMAAAAALVLAISLPLAVRQGAEQAGVPVAAAPEAESGRIYVHFRLDAPQATQGALAGDFTEWQPEYELFEQRPGVWSVVVPLEPGVHDYAFVIDGQRWVPDPLGVPVDDGFGGTNSRLSVLPPETRAL